MATVTQEHIEPYEIVSCVPHSKPVLVNQRPTYDRHVFVERPLLSALLFDNVDSDARDHCANERSVGADWLENAGGLYDCSDLDCGCMRAVLVDQCWNE
ncbi:hypothetical protein KCU98_g14725, partial [Aureobasidium melanogenum]